MSAKKQIMCFDCHQTISYREGDIYREEDKDYDKGVLCTSCDTFFHQTCQQVSENTWSLIWHKKIVWKCRQCRLNEDIKNEIANLNKNIENNISQMKSELIEFISDKYTAEGKRNEDIDGTLINIADEIKAVKQEVKDGDGHLECTCDELDPPEPKKSGPYWAHYWMDTKQFVEDFPVQIRRRKWMEKIMEDYYIKERERIEELKHAIAVLSPHSNIQEEQVLES